MIWSHNLLKKADLLTLPKLSFGLLFFLMMLGSLLAQSNPLAAIVHDWFDVILTFGFIFYLFKNSLRPSKMQEMMPLTSLILFMLGFYISYTDLRIIYHLFIADFGIIKELQIYAMIWVYYLIPIFGGAVIIDGLTQKS